MEAGSFWSSVLTLHLFWILGHLNINGTGATGKMDTGNSSVFEGYNYTVYHDKVNATQARTLCYRRDSELATIISNETSEWLINNVLPKLKPREKNRCTKWDLKDRTWQFWIGLTTSYTCNSKNVTVCRKKPWRWFNGQNMTWENWTPSEPGENEACVRMSGCSTTRYRWAGANCNSSFGYICFKDVNECLTSPCQNSGSCKNSPGSYSCSCTDGWTGQNCDQDIDECLGDTALCGSHGNCTNTNGSFTCLCEEKYTGTLCDTLKLEGTSTEPTVLYGLICLCTVIIVVLSIVDIVLLACYRRKIKQTRNQPPSLKFQPKSFNSKEEEGRAMLYENISQVQ